MNIRQKIKEVSLKLAGDIFVTDVRVGLVYTAVLLDNGQVGVAFTFRGESRAGCRVFKGIRPLAGKRASEMLAMFDSADRVESAVALATSNALSNTRNENPLEGDTLEYLDIHPEDDVAMVGYFAPLVPLLKKKANALKIFEQIDLAKGDLLPEKDLYRQLPHCQVAVITSTSIVNHTIDAILDAARTCREVVLLGASTPILPEVFADTPVKILSGVVVTDNEEIMRIVSEGGGMRLFKNYIRKVNVRLK
ncbi:MAG: DUF364 domain-containing protein [Deltaproteobacteria bacterium]|nr:DUF364 domain-containing protein [Deltaproteobacteria bacterium]MBW2118912.1 DUF364 domain-containing protein [Deltaproteobacteria bacterium]MBW2344420.1 DUF364 domain-containing protein [Deltaproteobacteria bacterium]